MTYSFSAKGPSKTEAILDADSKIDKLCLDMEVHQNDRDAVSANVRNLVNALPDPDYTELVEISMSGYITWTINSMGGKRITHISSSCSVGLAIKK